MLKEYKLQNTNNSMQGKNSSVSRRNRRWISCPSCNFKNNPKALFCKNCGNKLSERTTSISGASPNAVSKQDFITFWLIGTVAWIALALLFGIILTAMAAIIIAALSLYYLNSQNKTKMFIFGMSAFSLVGIVIAAYILNKNKLVYPKLSALLVAGLFFLALLVAFLVDIVIVLL
jgi:hypothetical protein